MGPWTVHNVYWLAEKNRKVKLCNYCSLNSAWTVAAVSQTRAKKKKKKGKMVDAKCPIQTQPRVEFGLGVWCLAFFFLHAVVRLRLLFMHCSMNSSRKVLLFYFFQPISAHRALFMDPQISLFSNFFIKNGSHGTIYTFKNYFATVFFSFQFQFSVFNCIQTDP